MKIKKQILKVIQNKILKHKNMNFTKILEIINSSIIFLNKYINFIKPFLVSLSLLSIIVWFYPFETYKDFGSISWVLLIIVMFIRPLRDLFPKCRIFSFLLKFRRELGILVGIFGIAHVIGYAKIMDYNSIFGVFTDEYVWNYKGYLFWGMLATIVSIPLLITSNGFSTHILGKYWKTLQRLAYFMFVSVGLHIYLIKKEPGPLIIVLAWLILIIISYFKNKKIKKSMSAGPKWLCVPCGYIYDENIGDLDSGILPGTRFEDIPGGWRCPVCGVGKSDFILLKNDIEVNKSEIVSLNYLTPDTIELKLDLQKDLEFISGQFLTFVLNDKTGDFNRSYSIANKVGNIYIFLIKLKVDGRAGILLKTKKVGDKINYTQISGNFTLKNTTNPKIFIATGTGLAPIYNMLLNTIESVNKKLYFGVANKNDLFYVDKLKEIKNLELKFCVSREEIEFCHFGRIDLSNDNFEKNSEFYICGNPGIVEGVKKTLKEKGFTQVYSEEF